MVSIKDVAKHAGVSIGTVSNVVNHPEVVARPTLTRVLSSIEELGYVRDETARQLRSGRSRLLAVLLLQPGNPFFVDVIRGAEQTARQEGLHVITCNSDHSADVEASYLSMLVEQRVRGVLLTPVDGASDESLLRLKRSGIACVLVDRSPHRAQACSVSVDDVAGGMQAVGHLTDLGHTEIVMVNGPDRLTPCRDREIGARRALAGRTDGARLAVLSTEELSVRAGQEAAAGILGLDRRPTAVFCANDLLALGVMQALTSVGLRVPQDIALVGYDDIEFAAAAHVPLTSVRQPALQLGRTATRLLLEETSPTTGADHRHQSVVFTPELVVRDSTAGG